MFVTYHQQRVLALGGTPAEYLIAGDAVVIRGFPGQGYGTVRVHPSREVCRLGRWFRWFGLRHRSGGLAGQRFFVVGIVGEGHPDLDGLAFVGIGQGVAASFASIQLAPLLS